MRKIPWLALALLFPLNSFAVDLSPGNIVDLSHSYNAQTIYWPTESGFLLEKEYAGINEKGYFYAAPAAPRKARV